MTTRQMTRWLLHELWWSFPAFAFVGIYGYAILTYFWAPAQLVMMLNTLIGSVFTHDSLSFALITWAFCIYTWVVAFWMLTTTLEEDSKVIMARRAAFLKCVSASEEC